MTFNDLLNWVDTVEWNNMATVVLCRDEGAILTENVLDG